MLLLFLLTFNLVLSEVYSTQPPATECIQDQLTATNSSKLTATNSSKLIRRYVNKRSSRHSKPAITYTTDSGKTIDCPPKFKRFQAPKKTEFYECEDGKARIQRCKTGTIYIPYDLKCITIASFSKSEKRDTPSDEKQISGTKPTTITQQLFGQSATLGTLYNRKTDEYFITKNLWKKESRTRSQEEVSKKHSNNEYFAGITSADKLDEMDISAELRMSFMAGLVKVKGSAEFYRESVVHDNEEVFNMAYKATTHTIYMPASIKVDNKDYCSSDDVTHVVSSVTYGLNAFFTFKKTTSSSSEKQKIAGALQAMVKSIPSFEIEGIAKLKIEGVSKDVFEQTKVSLNGDFLLAHSPTTFLEAIKAYKEITGLLTNDDNTNAQIIEIQLSPIQTYCKKADVVLVKISEQAMQTVTEVLDNLEKTRNKVETLLDTPAANRFQPVNSNLKLFRTNLKVFQHDMKSKLKILLPAIKGYDGTKTELDLVNMINYYKESPYSIDKSAIFLSSRKREIKALSHLLEHFKSDSDNVVVTDYETANDVGSSLKNEHVVVFDVNILVPTITNSYIAGSLDETSIWFNNDEDVRKVGILINKFKNFANSNKGREGFAYLIKVNKRVADIPTLIRANNKKFQIPQQPGDLKLKDRSYNSIAFDKVNKPNNIWINGFTVSYWKTAEGDQNKKEIEMEFPNNDVVIEGLNAATAYQFKISFETEFGRSSPSKETDIIFTRPSSPPSNLQIKQQTESSITVSWEEPVVIRRGLEINKYTAKLLDESKKTIKQLIVKTGETTFRNLKAFQQYFVEVSAHASNSEDLEESSASASSPEVPSINVAGTSNTISNPEDLEVFTAPPPPTLVTIKDIGLNSVTIQWVKPNIIPLATEIEYIVRYSMMDTNGQNRIGGTVTTLTAITQPKTKIEALAEGTYYQFQVKVVTAKGSSDFSLKTTAKTNFEQTKLDKLKEDISSELIKPDIAKLKEEITKKVNDVVDDTLSGCELKIGAATTQSGTFSKNPQPSTAACVKSCIEERKNHPDIDGVETSVYNLYDVYCSCIISMTGRNDYKGRRSCKLKRLKEY